MMCYVIIFFVKQNTANEMRISDWSSDVCSSDLTTKRAVERVEKICQHYARRAGEGLVGGKDRILRQIAIECFGPTLRLRLANAALELDLIVEIGRASCSERVC